MSQFIDGFTAEQILTELKILRQRRAALEAQHFHLLSTYQKLRARDGKLAERSAPDEIALELRIGHGYAVAQLDLATSLTDRLPTTLSALESGSVDLPKARAMVELTEDMSVEDARAVEATVLPKAESRTWPRCAPTSATTATASTPTPLNAAARSRASAAAPRS